MLSRQNPFGSIYLQKMRKLFALLLILFISSSSTIGICLCDHTHELKQNHCHSESLGTTHSNVKKHSCSCLSTKILPSSSEITSLEIKTKNLLGVLLPLISQVSENLTPPIASIRPQNLSPPTTVPLFLQKTSFLL